MALKPKLNGPTDEIEINYSFIHSFIHSSIHSYRYEFSVDLWALGILVYELNEGTTPFVSFSEDPMHVFTKILRGNLNCPNHFSKDLRVLVKSILTKDLSKRLLVISSTLAAIFIWA